MNRNRIVICLVFFVFTRVGFAQEEASYTFELKETELVPVGDSNNIFFDYDLDGDLDLIISGYNNDFSEVTGTHTFLYTNDGKGNFTIDKRSSFMGIEYGKIDVGDIDNDKDLDIVITGQELTKNKEGGIVIYKNENAVFKKIKKIEPDRAYSVYANFIDVNNDQYEDLLVELNDSIKFYVNDKKGDFLAAGNLEGIDEVYEYGVIPFDMDNDGDDDIMLQGEYGYELESKTLLFKNNSGKYESVSHNFKNTFQGIVVPVDIDNDGDQDVFMTNLGSISENLDESFFYINEEGSFKESVSDILVYNIVQSCFVDLDTDGDKDLIIMGNRKELKKPGYYTEAIDIYENKEGVFELIKTAAFPFLGQSSINTADVDGDGDQDVLLTGYEGETPRTRLYINKLK